MASLRRQGEASALRDPSAVGPERAPGAGALLSRTALVGGISGTWAQGTYNLEERTGNTVS